MGKMIGIDLGTTNSVVAIIEGGEPKVIHNEEGSNLTPSVVGFPDDGQILVGQPAKRQAITNPEKTVYSIKRFMGRRIDEVGQEIKMVPYKVNRGPNSDVQVGIGNKNYSPPEISAHVLMKLKRAAESYLGQPVKEAVITVPAYFNDSQRQATKDAGAIAGLDVKRIINEPTAAALAYGMDKKKEEKIAVFDFGGGTFDISILDVGENVVEVISTNGDTHLGGDDIDHKIIEYLMKEFKKDTGIDVGGDKMVLQRLKEAAEKAKIELSGTMETEINLPFLTADQTGPKHLTMKLSRAKFEALVGDILEKTLEPCRKAITDAKLKAADIDEVVLVGGSTRIPKVQEMVRHFFGREPHKGVNPDEVVAVGAAVQAGVLAGEVRDVLLLDVTPLSLGIETLGAVMTRLIERNTTIPTKKGQIFSTAADNQTSVEIHVLQGEREIAGDNRTLGRFILDGIPTAPRGMPQVEVTFDIDANGILHVFAKDLATQKEQKIRIESSSGLKKDEVEKLVQEARKFETEDKKHREEVDLRNQADSLVYTTEKTLKEHKEKLPLADVTKMEDALAACKKAIDEKDSAKIKQAMETLTQASHKIAEIMYKQAATSKAEAETKEEEKKKPKDEKVVDAEFEEGPTTRD